MKLLRIRYALLIAVLCSISGEAKPTKKEEDTKIQIWLIDRSRSINDLNPADTIQAMLVQATQVASLSKRPIKMGAILFNSREITVIGDKKGQPTLAHKKFLQDVKTKWSKAEGATPLDLALDRCLGMVKALPAQSDVTVIYFGDGSPESLRPRPKDFPAVQKYLNKEIQQIQARELPPGITQRLINDFKEELKNPETQAAKKLWKVQIPEEFNACLDLVAALSARKVRFLTVDFKKNDAMRKIHQSAGGTDADYVQVSEPNKVLQSLHKTKLTSFPDIIVPPPMTAPADSADTKATYTASLDDVAEAAVISLVFTRSIEDWDRVCELTMTAGGQTFTFTEKNNDPQAMLTKDGKGRIVMATLSLEQLPRDKKVTITFNSPKGNMTVPEMTLFLHERLSSGIQPRFRPEHVKPDAEPPYSVTPSHPLKFKSDLMRKVEGVPVDIDGLEVVLKRRRDAQEIPVAMDRDPGFPGTFLTPKAMTLSEGMYDVQLHCRLPSGAHFELLLPRHLQSRNKDEHLTFELDETSIQPDLIHLGEVGDKKPEGSLNIRVRSMNIDYPFPVKVEIVNAQDKRGNRIPPSFFKITRPLLVIQPGRPTTLAVHWKIPERMDGVIDGPCTAEVLLLRQDNNLPMDIRPHIEKGQASAINEIRFLLKRPKVSITVEGGEKKELKNKSSEVEVLTYVDVWKPFTRRLRFVVGVNSIQARELHPEEKLPLRDAAGKPYPHVSLVRDESIPTNQTIEPGEAVTWDYILHISDKAEFQKIKGSITFVGEGVQPFQADVVVQMRNPLLAPTLQRNLWWIAAILFLFAVIGWIVYRRRARYLEGSEVRITPEISFESISLSSRAKEGIELIIEERNIEIRQRSEVKGSPTGRRLKLTSQDLKNGLFLTKRDEENEVEWTLELVNWELDEQGEPVLTTQVYDSGFHAPNIQKANRKWRRRLVFASLFALIAWNVYSEWMVGWTQNLVDLARNWF